MEERDVTFFLSCLEKNKAKAPQSIGLDWIWEEEGGGGGFVQGDFWKRKFHERQPSSSNIQDVGTLFP
jgi:hypothetical protein